MSPTAETAARVSAAIEARDAAAVRALVADDPGAASARDARGRSLLLLAVFHQLPEAVTGLLEPRGDDLDALEAAATGNVDRLRPLLQADTAGVLAARTPEGF